MELDSIMARGLGSHLPPGVGVLNAQQTRAVAIVSVVFSSISLLLSTVAFYWFFRMKRSFRHQLVLFLIVSDSTKALWYLIYPIVGLSGYNMPTRSHYCQSQGFLLAFAIEASDFAILVIGLHAVIYIFRPPQRLGQGGLYQYRRIIYVLWVVLPTLAASLAFTNRKGPAYVSTGTFCYLPKRPFWYRLALAWIPRYLIFLTIFVSYSAIYIYVRRKFKGFEVMMATNSSFALSNTDPATARASISTARKFSNVALFTPFTQNMHGARDSEGSGERNAWDRIDFITAPPIATPVAPACTRTGDFAVQSSTTLDAETSPRPGNSRSNSDVSNKENRRSTLPQGVDPLPSDMRITRLAIQRQLRFMFIYPLVYIVLWTIPFINHCMQYSDFLAMHPQFWASLLSTMCLCSQAGVDALVFSWRERPWRRRRGIQIRKPTRFEQWVTGLFRKKTNEVEPRLEDHQQIRSRRDQKNWWDLEANIDRRDSVLAAPLEVTVGSPRRQGTGLSSRSN